MLAWTNKSDLNLSSSKEKIQKLDKNKINARPKKIYFKESCIIILTENGDVFKKGKYNFIIETNENQKENEEWIPIIRLREITKIKFGYYHILFLSKIGKIYSLGDNYYGQLGINKMMYPMIKSPIEVKYRDVSLIGKKIHAYKYNCRPRIIIPIYVCHKTSKDFEEEKQKEKDEEKKLEFNITDISSIIIDKKNKEESNFINDETIEDFDI